MPIDEKSSAYDGYSDRQIAELIAAKAAGHDTEYLMKLLTLRRRRKYVGLVPQQARKSTRENESPPVGELRSGGAGLKNSGFDQNVQRRSPHTSGANPFRRAGEYTSRFLDAVIDSILTLVKLMLIVFIATVALAIVAAFFSGG